MKQTFFIINIFISISLFGQVPDSVRFGQNPDSLKLTLLDTTPVPQSSIHLIAKNTGKKIILRWAPATPDVWMVGNKFGYQVEKLVFPKDDGTDKEFESVRPEIFKPLPVEGWEKYANNPQDQYPLVALEAIHGNAESYGKGKEGAENFLLKGQEFENRFSMAILSADLSKNAADASGLRWEDTDIDTAFNYMYRVYISNPTIPIAHDTAQIFLFGNQIEPMPTPVISKIEEGEKHVRVLWSRFLHQSDFTAYHIERSEDGGKTYNRLNDLPFVSSGLETDPTHAENFVYYDSLEQNYKLHHYKIIGLTPFGEISAASEPFAGMGRDRTPPPPPVNVKAEHLGGTQIKISWESDALPSDTKGFYIGRSESALFGFEPLHENELSISTRSFIDKNANPGLPNYYVVAVSDTSQNGQVSTAAYGLIPDNTPPAQPFGLKGSIDSSGVLKIEWELGAEPDIIGYQVYYANQDDHEYAQISNHPIQDTVFTDTINLRSLTEDIFFKIAAVDLTYNYSEFSEVLKLKKPDKIPPTSPIFTQSRAEDDHLLVEWANSQSLDVEEHILEKRSLGETEWETLKKFPGATVNFYKDYVIQPSKTYEYRIKAKDDDGLFSKNEFTLKLKAVTPIVFEKIDQLKGVYSENEKIVNLNWSFEKENISRFIIYRAVDEFKLKSYKSVTGDTRTLKDDRVRKNRKYTYRVKAIYENGRESGFSDKVLVKID